MDNQKSTPVIPRNNPHFNNSAINVVGTYHAGIYYKPELLNKIEVGKKVILKREFDNEHDANSILVYLYGEKDHYGWIPRGIAARLAPILDRGSRYECFVKEIRGRRQPQIIISLTTYPVSRPKPPEKENGPNRPIPPPRTHRTSPVTPTGKAFRRMVNFDAHCRKYNGVSGIYIIWNRRNKSYIGQSRDVGCRWRIHERKLFNRCHENKDLQNDWVQMGASEFRFDLLEKVEPGRLDEREKFHIIRLNTYFQGYNQTPDGQGNPNRIFSPSDKAIGYDEHVAKPDLVAQPEEKPTPDQAPPLQNTSLSGVPGYVPPEEEPKINKARPKKPITPWLICNPGRITIYKNPDGTLPYPYGPKEKNAAKKSKPSTYDMLEKYSGAFVAMILIIPFMILICFSFQAGIPPANREASYYDKSQSEGALQDKKRTSVIWHEVQRGDSLFVIANKYHTTVERIVADNGIENKNTIYWGEFLKIKVPEQERFITKKAGPTN